MSRRLLQRSRPAGFDEAEWNLLAASQSGRSLVEVTCSAAAYSCCGKGWHDRTGYEQTYRGRVTNLGDRSFMLMSAGIGTVSYTVAVDYEHVALVEPLD